MNREQLEREVPVWQACRNTLQGTMQGTIRWQFTLAEARVKLRRLYPTLQS
jgi:hypothetical protein